MQEKDSDICLLMQTAASLHKDKFRLLKIQNFITGLDYLLHHPVCYKISVGLSI